MYVIYGHSPDYFDTDEPTCCKTMEVAEQELQETLDNYRSCGYTVEKERSGKLNCYYCYMRDERGKLIEKFVGIDYDDQTE
jgi:hypothetical protein